MGIFRSDLRLPNAAEALPGRATAVAVPDAHAVNGRPLTPPWPEGHETIQFGMGCFWGAERVFWTQPGVYVTAVGYSGGTTPNPTYQEVCSGRTGHAEVVLVVFDPQVVASADLLARFWENHDPTQGMRQGNDVGTQYRSTCWCSTPEQLQLARTTASAYEHALAAVRFGKITTQIGPAPTFFYAEEYHQQYLHKNPMGYCGLGGTGVACPIGLGVTPPTGTTETS